MANTTAMDLLSVRPEDSPRLYVCEAKGCARKQSCAYRKLIEQARDESVPVHLVGCQGSCTGPTAVVVDADGPRWFEDLRTSKSRADVIALITGELQKPSKRLRRRQLRGADRKRALKKLVKSLERSPKVLS